jgi:hypothetical protein
MEFNRKHEEKHIVRRWTIEEKPGGGFIARGDNPPEIIEGATREEVQVRIREKLKELTGAALSNLDFSKLPLDQPGSVVKLPMTAKITFSLFRSGGEKPTTFEAVLGGSPDALKSGEEKPSRFQARLNAGSPGAIEPEGTSLLSAMWRAAVLVGIAVIIWLLLKR